MAKYTLSYFNIRARAEVSRFVLAFAGIEYEDRRINQSDWPSEKQSGRYPFNRLPTLEVDGAVLSESCTVARFLARKHGLYADDALSQARIDMVADVVDDIYSKLQAMFLEKDEAKKKEMMDKNYGEYFPNLLKCLEKLLVQNQGGDGYFVGDKVTLADLSFTAITYNLVEWKSDVFKDCPKLAALKTRVEKLPRIAEWMKKRPETPF
ncbi:hematopoietic prostaglandin D synthase-like [Ptychodera flava]|uniref:hematopoietic prostaglandin D synthase-like n=1 Tax=Ptychodera flava TaxID=63121 RepID=UPI003969F3A4